MDASSSSSPRRARMPHVRGCSGQTTWRSAANACSARTMVVRRCASSVFSARWIVAST
ncbi:Uncharacterised protein [Bordetella pertussis]|nr:Uncharacterised protein [Bordetella pertussis]